MEDVERQPQGAIGIPQSEEPSGSTYPTPQFLEIPGPESILVGVERHGSTLGAPGENTAVLISASSSNVPTHGYTESAMSGGSNSIPNTTVCIGTGVQSSQKCSMKGRV